MALQMVQGKMVYVVDLKTMPTLPIVGTGYEQYYAEALTAALEQGLIKIPGKYGIEIFFDGSMVRMMHWNVYRIDEPQEVEV
jgi:hypothetical protein